MWAPFNKVVSAVRSDKRSLEERVTRLEEMSAIEMLLNQYTYSYDGNDIETLMSLLHPDCTLVNPRGTYVGAKSIRENYLHLMSSRKFSFHHISNAVVRLSDQQTEALFTSYFNVVVAFKSGALAGSSGTYVCRLGRVDDWKITEMRITLNTRQSLTPVESAPIAPASSPDAPPPPPSPTYPETSRDWIGPGALV